MRLSKLLILLVFFQGIAATADEPEPIKIDQGEITNVISNFVIFDTYEEFWAALPDGWGKLEGYSRCYRELDVNMAWCTIYIVRPQVVDGEHTLTLGHEVEHGIWGERYHDD